MTTIVESSKIVDDQTISILIETDQAPLELQAKDPFGDLPDSKGFSDLKPVKLARDLYDDAMLLAQHVALRTMLWRQKMASSEARPDELELQFAIKMDAHWGAILAKAGAEAQLQVTMKWTNNE